MLRLMLSKTLLLAAFHAQTEGKITVAVIDSGISSELINHNMMCPSGHKDFTDIKLVKKKYIHWVGYGLEDVHGHGTHISGIIDQYAKGVVFKHDKEEWKRQYLETTKIDYCQVALKFYHSPTGINEELIGLVEALRYAIYDLRVKVINISAGGYDAYAAEKGLILEAERRGIKVIVAAGNDGWELGKTHTEVLVKYGKEKIWMTPIKAQQLNLEPILDENRAIRTREAPSMYFPAMYSTGIKVVGNMDSDAERVLSSNYGEFVNTWEIGENIWSYSIRKEEYHYMKYRLYLGTLTGTSQAAAVHTGKVIKAMLTH